MRKNELKVRISLLEIRVVNFIVLIERGESLLYLTEQYKFGLHLFVYFDDIEAVD